MAGVRAGKAACWESWEQAGKGPVSALSWQGQDPAESCLAFEGLIALEEKGLG